MNKKDRDINYIKENGNGYVTIQENLTGKKEGQTQFKVTDSKKVKPRPYPVEKKGGLTLFDKEGDENGLGK